MSSGPGDTRARRVTRASLWEGGDSVLPGLNNYRQYQPRRRGSASRTRLISRIANFVSAAIKMPMARLFRPLRCNAENASPILMIDSANISFDSGASVVFLIFTFGINLSVDFEFKD